MAGQIYSFEGVVPVIHPSTFIHPTAVVIGDVVIGPECYVGPGASLRGDFSVIRVGAGCNLQDNTVLHGTPGFETVVEDGGHIGHGAIVHGCAIGRNALVGMNACVFDGAHVGESAVVAGMSFVKAGFRVPARTLVAGVPAKVVRELSEEEIAWKTKGTRAYARLAGRCLETLIPCDPLPEPEPDRKGVDASTFWRD